MIRFPKNINRLAAAVVVSALVHLIAVFGHRIEILLLQPELQRLEASLIRTPPAPNPGQAPLPKEKPKPKVPKPTPQETPKPAEAEAQAPPVETPPPPPPQPEPEKKVEEKSEPQPEVPPEPPIAPEPPKVVGNAWPRAGQIKYLLFGGENRNPSNDSTAELRWEISEDGRYRMKLSSEDAKPFPAMPWFKISLLWSSEGRMVDGRFRPERYEEAVSVFQNIVVTLDWNTKVASFAGHNLPFQDGTLDYLSVIMQAGDPGFVEAGSIAVATGRGLRQYRFEKTGEGEMALPFGMTWKVAELVGKTGNNDVRVWVATEKFNLPVQIKFVVNKVNYYLVATEVRVAREFASEEASPKDAETREAAAEQDSTPQPAAAPQSAQ